MNSGFKEYQEFCSKGWKDGCCREVFLLGLAGESGEVMEIVKKSIRDDTPVNLERLKEELGDVIWYISNICTIFNLNLEDVIKLNIEKISKRYEDLIN